MAVEPFHLDAYLDEQMYRFNNRATKDNPLDDTDRFMLAISQISGKRLTCAELRMSFIAAVKRANSGFDGGSFHVTDCTPFDTFG